MKPSHVKAAAMVVGRTWPVLMCLLVGCATRNEASLVHPFRSHRFQECSVKLSDYRPVQTRPGQDGSIALALAISGGGQRASNFGVGVMLALEAIATDGPVRRNLLAEIDYFSTVSGGGLAAGAYISSLHDHLHFGGARADYSFARAIHGPHASPQRTDPQLMKHLEADYVDHIVRGMLAWTRHNRGEYLEQAFDDNVLGYLWRRRKLAPANGQDKSRDPSLTLGDVFDMRNLPAAKVRLPQWIANATVHENGAIFPFTPDHLKLYDVRGYTHRLKKVRHDSLRQTYDEFIAAVPLSVAMKASGTFPMAIPATTLGSGMDKLNPYLHLLDGGLADNLGVMTALRILHQDSRASVKRKVLIVVDAGTGTFAPFSEVPAPPGVSATALRTALAQLDSWRGRYREVVRDLCRLHEIQPVFLSFDDLADLKDFQPLVELGLSDLDLKALKGDGKVHGVPATPFTLVRNVLTWYDVTPAEQALMFAVGRYVVEEKRKAILDAIGR